MTEETILGTLVAKKTGIYTVYVFQSEDGSYRMCTKLPNWGEEYNLNIGDKGFVTMQTFIAGESYYNRASDKNETIRFTNVYFKEFLKENNNKGNKIIL